MAERSYKIKPLPADHPIYTRGWSIGARHSTNSSNNTPVSSSSNGKPKQASSSKQDPQANARLAGRMQKAALEYLSAGSTSIEDRLSGLRDLFEKGLITQAVYEQRQAEILSEQ